MESGVGSRSGRETSRGRTSHESRKGIEVLSLGIWLAWTVNAPFGVTLGFEGNRGAVSGAPLIGKVEYFLFCFIG